ncbi:MAG: hypothetical protein ACT4TC_22440 [Myxococcaceae bacterium]
MPPLPHSLFQNRLDVHDRKQFEIKLEYQPSGSNRSKYLVETFIFLPGSLNVDQDTYPRQDFYSDIHNYVRLKTPVLNLQELLNSEQSPMVRIEKWLESGRPYPEAEAETVYQAKLLSCIFRGALRRFSNFIDERCEILVRDPSRPLTENPLDATTRETVKRVNELMQRFRAWNEKISALHTLREKTRASFRLVEEYLSLTVEQFFRKAVADMEQLPRTGIYTELRKELMALVVREETYRKNHKLRSVISPTGDNEEYMHRIGFLKKFCMNILFLSAHRDTSRQGLEEALFAAAAGLAMAWATLVAFWAQTRFPQVSLNFFLILVVGYMMKDRIKEGLRRIFARVAARHLFDRSMSIRDPVTQDPIGTCKEKVDYGVSVRVPDEITRLRRTDDFVTVSQGELAETVIRYQKQILLNSQLLPRVKDGITGVTDIIRLNVDRLLRDMDDPEYALEYVDLEDFSVGRVKASKSYQVDLAFRFQVDDGSTRRVSLRLVRLVLDRNGIKRMVRVEPEVQLQVDSETRSVA